MRPRRPRHPRTPETSETSEDVRDVPGRLTRSETSDSHPPTSNWLVVGIRLETELLTQSVILFRVRHESDLQKQNRTINHWCLSTPYTKETLSTPTFTVAPLEPSRVDKQDSYTTFCTRSVGGWMSMLTSFIESVSQSDRQTDRRDGCMFSARLVQHLLNADPLALEADLRSV